MALSIRRTEKESLAYRSAPFALAGMLLFAAWSPLSRWLGVFVTACVEARQSGRWPRCDPRPDKAMCAQAAWIALALLFITTFVPVSRCLATNRHRLAIGVLLTAMVVGWGIAWLAFSTDAFYVCSWYFD